MREDFFNDCFLKGMQASRKSRFCAPLPYIFD